jgi:hypothetical protein
MGGGAEEIAKIALGVALGGTFVFGVAGRLAERITDDVYDAIKKALRVLLSRRENQVKRASVNVTIELGHDQWIFFRADRHRVGSDLDKLGELEVRINDSEPHLWYIDFDKQSGKWSISPLLFKQKGPPPPLP